MIFLLLFLLKDAHEVGSSNWMTATFQRSMKIGAPRRSFKADLALCHWFSTIPKPKKFNSCKIPTDKIRLVSSRPQYLVGCSNHGPSLEGLESSGARRTRHQQRAKGLERPSTTKERPTSTKGKLGHPRRAAVAAAAGGGGGSEGDSAWQRNRLWPEVLG